MRVIMSTLYHFAHNNRSFLMVIHNTGIPTSSVDWLVYMNHGYCGWAQSFCHSTKKLFKKFKMIFFFGISHHHQSFRKIFFTKLYISWSSSSEIKHTKLLLTTKHRQTSPNPHSKHFTKNVLQFSKLLRNGGKSPTSLSHSVSVWYVWWWDGPAVIFQPNIWLMLSLVHGYLGWSCWPDWMWKYYCGMCMLSNFMF